MTIKYHQ